MTREIDPVRVTLELIDDEDASRPFMHVEEEYPAGVEPSTVAAFYRHLLGEGSEVAIAHEDGRPIVRLNSKEPTDDALRVSSAIALGLAHRAGVSEGALAEVAAAVADREEASG